MIDISIIMPIYNSMRYLHKNIKSILNQTYTNFELILIDDGSKDKSLDICKQYEKWDKRVKVYHIDNHGVSYARNYGIKKAIGKYIRFVDADDYIPPDSLEKLITPMLLDNNIELTIGRYDSNDKELYCEEIEGLVSIEYLVRRYLMYMSSFYYGVIWNKLYVTEIIKRYNIQFQVGLHWSEDLLFNISYYKKCSQIYYVDSPVYYYYRQINTLANTLDDYSIEEALQLEIRRFKATMELIEEKCNDDTARKLAYDFLFERINKSFNDLFLIDYKQSKNRYHYFCQIFQKSYMQELINQYSYRNDYFFNRLLVYLVKNKKYRWLYEYYHIKSILKKNKMLSAYINKQNWTRPKFQL